MLASADALARAGDGVFRGSLLADASWQEMTRFIATGTTEPPEYGLGLLALISAGSESGFTTATTSVFTPTLSTCQDNT
jgi:hypothetical protein